MKSKATYGQNDTFRLGYMYSITYIILAVVVIYSVSCPLIHLCGLIFYSARLYLDTYTLAVYHDEEMCSNMRIIEKVIQTISAMVGFWIFLIATTMIFAQSYSNSIVLYIFCGIVIYFASSVSDFTSLKDSKTDDLIFNKDIRDVLDEWKKEYSHPFNPVEYELQMDAYVARKYKYRSTLKK